MNDIAARLHAATPPHNVRPWPLPTATSPRVDRLRSDVKAATDPESVVTAFLADIGTPLLEPADEPGWALFTFLWRGHAPHGVTLQLNRLSDPMDLGDTLLEQVADTTLHTLTLRLPDTWLGSYVLIPLPEVPRVMLHNGIDRRQLAPLRAAVTSDELAREQAPNKDDGAPVAPPPLAVARGPEAPSAKLWESAPVPTVELGEVRSPVNDAPLRLRAWSHPSAGAGSTTVLLTDGEVWADQFPLAPALRQRIDAGVCPPLHLVFLDSAGPRQRQFDYPSTVEESGSLLRSVRAAFSTGGRWIVAGQSLGGLFAALCATRHPDLVAGAIAQSPSFWWPSSGPWGPRGDGWFAERAEARDAAPILLQCGSLEWVLVDRVRDAAALLTAQDSLIAYDEFHGGHDVVVWQALLPEAIQRAVTP